MPYINVRILEGATKTQKRAVVADITATMIRRLGKTPEHIHIVIDEVRPENWGFAGRLTKDILPAPNRRTTQPRRSVGKKA
ncbi:MAG TPA: 4-oxalocrotonate tautomerase family protein [Opitutaceae bacterium]|nr:4-oxalocrotonate tautomerase family protein [Opitutaceae bacterium]